jgi:hypothetical protein
MANAEDAVAKVSRMAGKPVADAELERLQRKSFSYFLHETNPDNGLVIDKTAANWPASIAATGFALAAYPVAV